MPTRMIVLLSALCITGTAPAADSFNQLPAQGAWARFYVTVQGVSDLDMTLEFTLRSTGRAQENGQDCRWVEFETQDVNSGMRVHLYKMLIPEEELKQGPITRSDVVRSWIANEGQAVQSGSEASLFPFSFLFPDSPGDPQRLADKATVDWQRGKLECTVLEGSGTSRFGNLDVAIEYRYLLNEQTPFGLGGFHSEVTFSPGTKIKIEGRLLDVGADAASSLPNSR